MRVFKIILIKELKSMIRDPKILIAMFIVPFIIVGVMYGIVVFSTRQMVEEAVRGRGVIAIVDEDQGYWSKNLTEYIKSLGFKILRLNNTTVLLEVLNNRSILSAIVIPSDFTENITRNNTAYVEIYTYIHSPSMSHLISRSKAIGVIMSYSQNLSETIIKIHGLNPKYISHPVNTTMTVILKDKMIHVNDLGALIGGFTMINIAFPLIAFILASFLVQLTATSIAVEKEEKMFETILSLPINRLEFIAAKIVAAVIIGFIGIAFYGALFAWYFGSVASISSSSPASSSSFNVFGILFDIYGSSGLGAFFIASIGLILFVLGIAIILALFVEDVRSAQMITSYIVMPFMFVLVLSMFLDITSYPQSTRYIISLIPFVNISFMSTFIFTGDQIAIHISALSSILYAILIMYIASKLIGTEKVFTLKLFRRKKIRT
ncbi:MAG: sodium transporter [Desulfurococcales archaeon ex4484_58]|nr:MAG: sodium transporter [Desulfurococcales archaeon ex4484_58]